MTNIAKVKKVHMAVKDNPDGIMSALCFERPRVIPLSEATLRAEVVTCKACLRHPQLRQVAS